LRLEKTLVIPVTLQAISGADPKLTFVTSAAETAFLSCTLPQGVSIQDLSAGTTADLTWVTPVPVPAAIGLFGSALLGLIGIARGKKVA
jgi:hypothetical protein